MAGLTSEQRRVLATILRVANRVHATPKERLAAVETGLVETHLRNLRYGDGTSVGWRQETKSSYPNVNRLNVAGAARRFFSEARQVRGRYGTAGALAQAVQRSAYPDRYQEARPEAKALLRNFGGGGVSAGGGRAVASSASGGLDFGDQGSALALLQSLGQGQPQQAPSAGLPSPSFSARPALPSSYQGVQGGGGPQKAPDVQSLLAAIQTAGGATGGSGQVDVSGGVSGAQDGSGGITQAGSGPDAARKIFERAVKINGAKLPYKWGGGHGGRVDPNKPVPLDCSGAVSAVLGINPRVSGQFESWGKPGHGRNVTIYANGHHVLMEINGHFFGTSSTNPGGGAGWIPRGAISPQYLKGFTVRHPTGL